MKNSVWKLESDFYWNSPEPFWQGMPNEITNNLSQSIITIVKGDANYRRVHGDLHWPYTYKTNQLASYFPSTFVMLRTLKSEVQSGLDDETLNWVSKEEDWLVTGKFGVIQSVTLN